MNAPPHPPSIGRYRIVRRLGAGGMGEVFLAEDPHIERRLAIKTLHQSVLGLTDVEEHKQRLLREARAAGRLLHPNVVTLFDADEDAGTLFLAFEFVDGPDLAHRLQLPPPLTLGQSLQVVREVASALEYAHREGIVHRDVKPSNVLIAPNGSAKVADFGLAKLTGESLEITRTGAVLGSPQYMSPEQVRGEALDGRSDLFSLGVVLYEMVAGLRPFTGETISTLVFEILGKEPMELSRLRPEVPPALAQLVQRLLAKDRERRLGSATELLAALDALLAELPTAALARPAGRPAADSSVDATLPTTPLPAGATATLVPTPPPVPAAAAPPPPPPRLPSPPAAVPLASSTSSALPSRSMSAARPRSTGKVLAGVVALAVVVIAALIVWMQAGGDRPEPAPGAAEEQLATLPGVDPGTPPPAGPPATTAATDPLGGAGTSGAGTRPTVEAPAPPPSTPPRSTAPPPRAATAAPPVSAPPASTPPPSTPATSTPSTSTPSTSTPSTSAPSTAPPPDQLAAVRPSPRPVAPPEEELLEPEPEEEFDELAAEARREVSTGRGVQFRVEPENAIVRTWRRGDKRQIVHGQVSQFDAKSRKGRVLELPENGDYLITLVSDELPDYMLLVHATDRRGAAATPIQVDLAEEARATADTIVQVGRALAFNGSPANADVYVDGALQGKASQWRPTRRRVGPRLQLEPGFHEIRLEAPGYRPYTLKVEAVSGGGRLRETVRYQLRRER